MSNAYPARKDYRHGARWRWFSQRVFLLFSDCRDRHCQTARKPLVFLAEPTSARSAEFANYRLSRCIQSFWKRTLSDAGLWHRKLAESYGSLLVSQPTETVEKGLREIGVADGW
jgi:hypothetical protein